MSKVNQFWQDEIEKICNDYTNGKIKREKAYQLLLDKGFDEEKANDHLSAWDTPKTIEHLAWRRAEYKEAFQVLDAMRTEFITRILAVAQETANTLDTKGIKQTLITNSALHALGEAGLFIIDCTDVDAKTEKGLLSVFVGNILLSYFERDTKTMMEFCNNCIKMADDGYATRH